MGSKSTPIGEKASSESLPEQTEHTKAKEVVDVEAEAIRIAREEKWRVDAYIETMEEQLKVSGRTKGPFEISHKNPKHFTWFMAAFASMGGLLFGLDQSIISGANLFMPDALGLDDQQVSLVNAGMPLGAIAGAALLTPANELLGRRRSILLATIFYTIGAALMAGANGYGLMISGRVVMGLGVGIEASCVPMYTSECVDSKIRGNLVSLYQLMVALGEVLGYVVAAIFVNVKGNWRYILGSSVVFSTLMFVGYVLR